MTIPRPASIVARQSRAGLSLLEVLVACGILVIGLASIAAMLPAAGSRFAQATQADRAVTVLANAYAEIVSARVAQSILISKAPLPVVFGVGFTNLSTGTSQVAGATSINDIDRISTYFLEDDLEYSLPSGAETPRNVFDPPGSGVRKFNPGICWGAMISAKSPAKPGVAATLLIAVFKRDGGPPKPISLTPANGVYRITSESDLKTYLTGCSYVSALGSGGTPPQWFRINSSWVQGPGDCRISFDNNGGLLEFAGPSPQVLGFEQLLLANQYAIRLE